MTTGSDNRSNVLAVLRAATRRLLAVRVVEAAAVGAVAAGLAGAAGQAGVLAARANLIFGVVVAMLPVAAAVLILARPGLQRAARLHGTEVRIVAGIICVAAVIGAAAVLLGRAVPQPRILLPLVLAPAGALAGAGSVLLRGCSLAEGALYHDIRFGLAERLSTAAELASRSGGEQASPSPHDEQISDRVFAQAVAAAEKAEISRRALWRRTRATAGALVLTAALCGMFALIWPPGSAQTAANSLDEVRHRVRVLNPREKRQLVDTLRKLAAAVRNNPDLARKLLAAAEAADKDQKTDAHLRELQDALATADDAEAARIAREILRAVGLPGGDGAGGGPGKTGTVASNHNGSEPPLLPDANSIDIDPKDKPLQARTLVYDPQYAATDANSPAASPSHVGPSPFVSFNDAWSRARARAAEAVRSGAVAPKYRKLVRRFYELE